MQVDDSVAPVSENKDIKAETVQVCNPYSYFKPFEDYRLITDTTSSSYQYIYSNLYIDDSNGLLKNSDGAIAVAMSDQYGPIGTEYELTLASGQQLLVVITDIKASVDLYDGCTDTSGAMIEFVTDSSQLPSEVWQTGSLEVLFPGTIENIERK